MSVHKSDDFISDVERQYEWYGTNANWEIADRYLDAIQLTYHLLDHHPLLGPRIGFSNQQLSNWRFIVVSRPFQKHIIFYETKAGIVTLRRAMHGHQNLPERLLK